MTMRATRILLTTRYVLLGPASRMKHFVEMLSLFWTPTDRPLISDVLERRVLFILHEPERQRISTHAHGEARRHGCGVEDRGNLHRCRLPALYHSRVDLLKNNVKMFASMRLYPTRHPLPRHDTLAGPRVDLIFFDFTTVTRIHGVG